MSTTARKKRLRLGPRSAGMLLTPEEFDAAVFRRGWRYELINGVLVVSPSPLRNERDPNEELGHWLRTYQEKHPQGSVLDLTLNEETVKPEPNRRRADRAIWVGLGHLPDEDEPPTILVEFVSESRENRERDYEAKRAEYRELGVREYWILDRFQRRMTVVTFGEKETERTLKATEVYTTTLLPGFELPLTRLFELANRWSRRKRS